ncbi:Histidine phosphatase superfamily [Rhypophila sp. PSN 637]
MRSLFSISLGTIAGWQLDWLTRRSARHYRLLGTGDRQVPNFQTRQQPWEQRKRAIISAIILAMILALFTFVAVTVAPTLGRYNPLTTGSTGGTYPVIPSNPCDSPENGFWCEPDIAHSWGQYSPYFTLKYHNLDAPKVPKGCKITFAQVLSRHGARDPTAGKSLIYKTLIDNIHRSVTSYGPGFEFLGTYTYDLGSDQLTPLGERQMINSGIKFYTQYQDLARDAKNNPPFIRSSGQQRVVESAEMFMQGYHSTLESDKKNRASPSFPYPILTIPESANSNNTLSHGLCTAFESPDSPYSSTGSQAQATYASTFTPHIISRLRTNLPGYNFSSQDVISLMDLCPFNTVAAQQPYKPTTNTKKTKALLSPFCYIFTVDDWKNYDYYQTLGKWYSYGPGNPLGPTQGVGYVNELIARMTARPVVDHTSTNSTLDSSPITFPLDRALYADFSHDNDMVSVLGALGLYNLTGLALSNTTRMEEKDSGGFSARWTVPFAGRIYFEKMRCEEKELVRILVNDEVVRLRGCAADELGRCTLDEWVESLGFVRGGGEWDRCFEEEFA